VSTWVGLLVVLGVSLLVCVAWAVYSKLPVGPNLFRYAATFALTFATSTSAYDALIGFKTRLPPGSAVALFAIVAIVLIALILERAGASGKRAERLWKAWDTVCASPSIRVQDFAAKLGLNIHRKAHEDELRYVLTVMCYGGALELEGWGREEAPEG